MLHVKDKSSPCSSVPVLYQCFIPSLYRVGGKESNCFRSGTLRIEVESRLTLLCVCHFETHVYFFIAFPRCLDICEHNYSHIFPSKNCRNFPVWPVFRSSYSMVHWRPRPGWEQENHVKTGLDHGLSFGQMRSPSSPLARAPGSEVVMLSPDPQLRNLEIITSRSKTGSSPGSRGRRALWGRRQAVRGHQLIV